jgi:transcriptional regulator with XRE-family HTH domain
MTQEQLAKEAGVAPSTVYMIEAGRGRDYPQFGTIRKLASALGVDPAELVKEGEDT